ncbi:MAG: hypothetical protein WDO24_13405 [Pseudomonadota bacterium]
MTFSGRLTAFLGMAIGLSIVGTGGAGAQDADHPPDKVMVVGSDFGVAPWMVRGTAGPEGFGVD